MKLKVNKIIALIFLINSIIFCQYIDAGKEFAFNILINNIHVPSPHSFYFQCRFIKNDSSSYTFRIDSFLTKYKSEYDVMKMFFDEMLENKQNYLTESEKSKLIETLNDGILTFYIYPDLIRINFEREETYNIRGEVNMGWPSSFGLFISKGNKYLFIGVSDWELNKSINLPKDIPIQISFYKLLNKRVKTTDYYSYTNLLYRYNLGNENIDLNQNESANIGGYFVYQGLSREQVINEGKQVFDGGVNGLSFIIIKR